MKLIVHTDIEREELVNYLKDGSCPSSTDSNRKSRGNFINRCSKFRMEGNLLLYSISPSEQRIVIANNSAQITAIVTAAHLPGHRGVKRTWKLVLDRYVGFSRSHVEEYVAKCEACQRHLPFKLNDEMGSIVATTPWERIQIDLVDMRKHADVNDGASWILNIIDCFSKFMFCFALQSKSGQEVVNALRGLFMTEGAPAILQSDNGKEFVNANMKDLLNEENIQHIRGRPRHPQSQGQVERANQTLVRMLAKSLHNAPTKRWVTILPAIVKSYNISWHRATNKSPMLGFRGRKGFNHIPVVDEEDNAAEEDNTADEERPTSTSGSDVFLLISDSDSCEDIAPASSMVATNSTASTSEDRRYAAQYRAKMQQDASVHYRHTEIFPGDKVLIRKDFDQNPGTKRTKMEGFYEDGVWEVCHLVRPGQYLISNNGQIRTVETKLLKKQRL
jgi:transposase InsO family protein